VEEAQVARATAGQGAQARSPLLLRRGSPGVGPRVVANPGTGRLDLLLLVMPAASSLLVPSPAATVITAVVTAAPSFAFSALARATAAMIGGSRGGLAGGRRAGGDGAGCKG